LRLIASAEQNGANYTRFSNWVCRQCGENNFVGCDRVFEKDEFCVKFGAGQEKVVCRK
jgi:hypothetical protein